MLGALLFFILQLKENIFYCIILYSSLFKIRLKLDLASTNPIGNLR